jgi:signal transduction histidine kinase
MPTGIDARALYSTSAFVFLGLVISVLLAYRELRGTPGLGRFVSGYCALIAGTGLFAVRDRIPDSLTIVVANVLVVLGAAFVLEGIALFYGLAVGYRITLSSAFFSAPVFAWFTWVEPSSLWRTVFSSMALAALLGAASWTAGRARHEGSSRLLDTVTALALGACALLFMVRAALVGMDRAASELLAEDLLTALGPLVGMLSAVIWTTSLLTNANRRLTHVVRSQTDLLTSLFEVARVGGDGTTLDATLEKTLEAVCSLTGANGSSLLLLDEEGRYTRGLFTCGNSALVMGPEDAESVLKDGLAAWVVREGTAALVPDVLADSRWKALPSHELQGIRSALAAPILTGPSLVGVITLVHSRPSKFTEDQRRLLESTTAQIALVLRNAQIADARLRANRQKDLLNEVLDISARGTVAEEIASGAAEAISRGSGIARVVVALPRESDRFRIHGPGADVGEAEPEIASGILGRAFATGKTQLVDESPADIPSGSGGLAHLVVPLNHRHRTLGVLAFEGARPRAFEPADVAFAEALGEAIALGLGNAALFRAREELTRAMVHDLRNPAVSIMGSLELLRSSDGLSDVDRKLVDTAERNAKRQDALIEEILDLSRLEEGALPVRPVESHLDALIADVLRLSAPRAEAKGVELLAEVPDALPPVFVDPDLIARVLENLVGNAIKFSPPGAGPVKVSARSSGEFVEVRVSDSGPGVEEEHRSRLFQKFAPGNLAGRGAGLGLAFCRLAVEANGGRIRLERSGSGSVFAFSVPVNPPSTPRNGS